MKRFSIIIFFLFIFQSNAFSHYSGTSADSLELRIDAVLRPYIGDNSPGATIGIIDNGVLIFNKGYGMANLKKKIPNSSNVSYKIASLSKQFTAASIVTLIQQNKISLNDNIRKYITEMPDYGKPITIANLLYHTSGIRDYMVLMWLTGKSFEERFSNKDALEIILNQHSLNFITGNRCVYSNSNYILLAEIVRKVTGISLKEYAHQDIFSKLKMNNSGFNRYQFPGNSLFALSYKKRDAGYVSFKNDNQTFGDGGVITTITDLVIWDKTFYDPKAGTAQLLNPGKLENGGFLTYGMGIMTGNYRNESIQMHPGAFLGYRTEMLRFPKKKITIICLGNSDVINPETITRMIADIYVFNDQSIAKNKEVQTLYNSIKPNMSFIGKYEIAPNIFVDIKFENNQLTGQATGQQKQPLHFDKENTYQIGSTGDQVVFKKNYSDGTLELEIVQKQGTTIARKLDVVSPGTFSDFLGSYYNSEQKATYRFFSKNGSLWFKVGTNPPEKADILKKYNRLYFNYQNLESATIEFYRNVSGRIEGFTLNSGRVSGLRFTKK